MEIVLASSNPHKVKEINEIVANTDLKFILPPDDFNPIENGTDFEQNSYIKAIEAWKLSKTWVLADDSGLCIDALDGKPGIYSARYDKTQELRIQKVLNEMKDKQVRDAHFTCAMTLINPSGNVEYKYSGICKGKITYEPKGSYGFGYDPIFLPENETRTMAELSEDEKNKISHRAIALNNVLDYINKAHLADIS